MEWISVEDEDRFPIDDEQVVVAMWRPDLGDYAHFIAKCDGEEWFDYYDGEPLSTLVPGYKILFFAYIEDPPLPPPPTA